MSGVLLTVAFYAILRFKAVTDLALGPGFARTLLVIVALLSLAVAASLLLTQRDYKRMLAYSSIEHMGLIALGAAAGIPLAIAAVLLHILGHGLAKSVLFLTSGEIMAAEGTSQIDGVRALLARRPALGGVFGVGLVALLGLPPFSLFTSELLMARAEFEVGLGLGRRRGHGGHGGRSSSPWSAMPATCSSARRHRRRVRRTAARLGRGAAGRRPGRLRLHRRVRLAALGPARGRGPCGGAVIPATSRAGDSSRSVATAWAGTCRSGDLVDVARTLFAEGMRLALVSGHDDGDRLRVVYLFTAGPPDTPGRAASAPRPRRGRRCRRWPRSRFPASRFERELPDLFGIEPGRPPPTPAPGPAPALAARTGIRCATDPASPPRWSPTPARSRSCRSRAPASTRSRSGRCTPGSSSPGTSASGWSARPSCA